MGARIYPYTFEIMIEIKIASMPKWKLLISTKDNAIKPVDVTIDDIN